MHLRFLHVDQVYVHFLDLFRGRVIQTRERILQRECVYPFQRLTAVLPLSRLTALPLKRVLEHLQPRDARLWTALNRLSMPHSRRLR